MLNKITSLSPYVLGGGAGIPQWKGHLGVPLRCGFLCKFLDPVTFYIDAAVHEGPEVDDLEATKLQQGGKEATEQTIQSQEGEQNGKVEQEGEQGGKAATELMIEAQEGEQGGKAAMELTIEAQEGEQGGKAATELIDGGGTEKRDDRPEIADKDQGPPGEADEGQE